MKAADVEDGVKPGTTAAGSGAGRTRSPPPVTEPRTYTVVLSAAAKRAIELDLPAPVAVAVVYFLYGPLATDPHRVGKPLRFELDGYWSARRGQYRVIHSIHDDEIRIRVVRISHRADSYR